QPRAAARSRRARAARPSTAPFSYLRVVHRVTTLPLSLRRRSLSNCSGFVLRLFFATSGLRPLCHLTPLLRGTVRYLPGRHRRDRVKYLRRVRSQDTCHCRTVVLSCRVCAGTICGSTSHWTPETARTCSPPAAGTGRSR